MGRAFLLLMGLLLGLGLAQASTITFDLQYLFTGTAPGYTGTGPWATATITDDGQPSGTVKLTMEATHLQPSTTAPEFISEWWFNVAWFDRLAAPADLTLALVSGFQASLITQGNGCCRAGSDGYFDLRFDFPTANDVQRFTNGATSVYTISGAGLTVADFDALGTGRKGGYPAMAHVQDAQNNTALGGWITNVPEPATFGLIGAVLIAGGTILRRRFSA